MDPALAGLEAAGIIKLLEGHDIEARPVWKLMRLQPVYRDCRLIEGQVAEGLFRKGVCLPSGSSLDVASRERVIGIVRDSFS